MNMTTEWQQGLYLALFASLLGLSRVLLGGDAHTANRFYPEDLAIGPM